MGKEVRASKPAPKKLPKIKIKTGSFYPKKVLYNKGGKPWKFKT